ncbi:MAG TPA: NUDIX domain-containing protein [Nocardioidaceae bacterium]|nr:NUDIX domain-containing protein [Nocardioidaceae bacterium]
MDTGAEPDRVDCVGGIVTGPDGRLLLIQRGKEPAKGCWSVPGGRVEWDETLVEAAAREVLEETGVAVVVGDLVGTVERDAPDGTVYVIYDFACTPIGSLQAVAGDDADAAGWFTAAEVRELACSPGLVEALVEWGVLR